MWRLLIVGFVLLIETPIVGWPMTPQADGPSYDILVFKTISGTTYLARSDGSQPRLVPDDIPLASADAWSPDRRKIAFLCADGLVQFIDERGIGQSVQELDKEHGVVAFKEADSTPGVVPLLSSMLCVLNADGSGRERLVDFPVIAPSMLAPAILAWSPDSTRLVFASNFNDDRQAGNAGIEALALFVVDVRTRQITRFRHIFENVFPFETASWSRDGVRIAFTSHDGGVYVVNMNDGASRRIARGASAVFSPQEDRIAFLGEGGVFTIKADGSDQRRVWSGTIFYSGVTWSPDGRLLFLRRLNQIIDVQTGTTVGELEEGGRNHTFTPDSRHVIYAGDAIYSVAVDGSDKRKISEWDSFLMVPAGSPAPLADRHRKSAGRIRGRVTSADSGAPLEQAVVYGYGSIITDADGNYELRDLPPGRYSLAANKGGYTTMSYGKRRSADLGRDIDLADGQVLDGVNFALSRTAILAGRVLDELNRPVANMEVQALQAIVNGQREFLPTGLQGTTTAAGEYRIADLDAGTYYVVATGLRAPTYYPDVPSIARATRVAVSAGQERRDLTLRLVPARTARVTGTIIDSSGRAPRKACINVASLRPAPGVFQPRDGNYNDDGTFVVSSLPPGEYRLIVRPCASVGAGPFGYEEFAVRSVTLNGVDVSGLRIAMTQPKTSTLSGRIRFDGEGNSAISPERTFVNIRPLDDVARASSCCNGWCDIRLKDDWSFTLPRLAGRWSFEAFLEQPGPAFQRLPVKAVLAGERDVTHSSVNFSSGGEAGDIEIVLRTNRVGVLAGSVHDRDRPVDDYRVIAFSVDIKDWGWGSVSRNVHVGRPDQNGQFRIAGLFATDYFVVALPTQGIPTELFFNAVRNAKLLKRLSRYATKVSISDAQVITLRLRMSLVVP